jgi:hypothetical protein
MKKEDKEQALLWFDKSLSEHRDPEIVKKQKELEKFVKEHQRQAYINPEISEQEKNLGNELFKKGCPQTHLNLKQQNVLSLYWWFRRLPGRHEALQ